MKIELRSDQDISIFMHEFYHHLQNVTTILGAERFNLFIQLIGHIAKLGTKAKVLKVPLNKWMPKEDKVQHDLYNILSHISMWDYLEKKNIYTDFFEKEDIGSIVEGPPHEEGDFTPCYVKQYQNRLIGYPIGGFTLSESSAFSLEQLFSKKPKDIDELEPENHDFQYTLISFLVAKLTQAKSKEVFELTLMLSELVYSISTPGMGFLLIYSKLFSEVGNDINFKQRLIELSEEFKDSINENIDSEIEMLKETQKNSEGFSKELKEMIDWQISQLQKGLRMRQENPYFVLEKLIYGKENEKDIAWLINEFSPSVIQLGSKDVQNFEITHYELLNTFSKIAIGLVFSPPNIVS